MAELPKLPLTFMRGPYEPLLIERGEGAWLYTADGRKILDAAGGAVVTNIGQGREEIAQLVGRGGTPRQLRPAGLVDAAAPAAGRAACAMDAAGPHPLFLHFAADRRRSRRRSSSR